MLRSSLLAPLAFVLVAPVMAATASLPTRAVTIGNEKLTVEVVETPEQRAVGLMNRFSLQPDHGMLFVFDQPQRLAFWMKNTYIPLSIAFVDAGGAIINIEDMRPQDESTHWSRADALYAIEAKQGWFAAKGITPGMKVTGLPPASRE
jgi:uncharacterized membrane protein (UPF0127 family)